VDPADPANPPDFAHFSRVFFFFFFFREVGLGERVVFVYQSRDGVLGRPPTMKMSCDVCVINFIPVER
jgi:hypothetical protein